MSEWQDISTAPKDGTLITLKRVYERRLVAEGRGLFGMLHEDAPSRTPMGPDPLNRLSTKDYAREADDTQKWSETPKWLREDRMYAFPQPTHWQPLPAPPNTEKS